MIAHLKNSEINRDKWDSLLAEAHGGTMYSWSAYLDIVCPQWEALVLNDYEAVIPLTLNRKFGIWYLFTPPFVQKTGIFSRTPVTPELADQFWKAMPEKIKYTDLQVNEESIPQQSTAQKVIRQNFELDISSSPDEILGRFAENHRRNIKKALAEGLEYAENISAESITELFMENNPAASSLSAKKAQIPTALLNRFSANSNAFTAGILNKEGKLLAGAILLRSSRRIIFLFSGNSTEGKEKKAMFLLIWELIRKNCGMGITFDFEGSDDENLARFYKGFGATNHPYVRVIKNDLPLILRWLKK